MLKQLALAGALLCALTIAADARPRSYLAHPDCNVTMPCAGVAPSARGEMIARQLGFGGPQNRYTPSATVVAHPPGCPSRAFCGCGAAVRVFGSPRRDLWTARAWFRFARTMPKPGAVAVRKHHVFVLERHIGGDLWQVYDANSGRGLTRVHARSIAGYVIVDPRAG